MGVFGDINKVEIMGNITQDLDLRYTANGNAVVNFSIATNRNFRSGDEWKEDVTFHNVVVWGTDAEQLGQRARKGTRIYVQGRLQTRSWENNEGQTQYKTETVAEKVILIDRYSKSDGSQVSSDSGGSDEPKNDNKPKDTSSKPKKTSQKVSNEDVIDPDDLPF